MPITPALGFQTVLYTDDDGTQWRMRAKIEYVSQTGGTPLGSLLGAVLFAGEDAEVWPANWTPRGVIVGNAEHGSRTLTLYSTTASILQTPHPPITLRNSDGTVDDFTFKGRRGEKRGQAIGVDT